MTLLSGIILGVIYIVLSALYIRYVWNEPEEKEPEIIYSNYLHELIEALYKTDGEIQLVREMKINIDTADSPVQGDAVRSMDIYWDWCGKLEQQAAFPITKGTATAEAMMNLAEVREEELLRKLTQQLIALPRPEISGKQ